MRLVRSFSFVAVALSLGAAVFAARPAQAAICCSAEICQQARPPAPCFWCNSGCFEDEEAPTAGEVVYDEVEQLCYVAGDLDADGESAGCE